MKSVVCHGPRDLRVQEQDTPIAQPGEVLVQIKAGGICGSDLHYFHNGGFGAVRIREPMVLGHEVAGVISALGTGVSGLEAGDLVAINPSHPCGSCEYCDKAFHNQCLDMRYYGSAMRFPHVQGAFSQFLAVDAKQCVRLPAGMTATDGAFAEPFAVALHAVRRAGSLIGKRVLITGCGPIGALTVAAAKIHGAMEVVVTDVVDAPLKRALQVGADKAINVATDAASLEPYARGKGVFDVVIEASGNESALLSALDLIRPRGRLIQLGLGGDITLPPSKIVGKEIEWCGSFRFHEEFAWAVELIAAKRVNLAPILSSVHPVEDAVAAFEAAGDRNHEMKVVLSFG